MVCFSVSQCGVLLTLLHSSACWKLLYPQHQGVGAQQNQFELVLDLPVALGLVDELTAAQVQLQVRQQVPGTFITLTHRNTGSEAESCDLLTLICTIKDCE